MNKLYRKTSILAGALLLMNVAFADDVRAGATEGKRARVFCDQSADVGRDPFEGAVLKVELVNKRYLGHVYYLLKDRAA